MPASSNRVNSNVVNIAPPPLADPTNVTVDFAREVTPGIVRVNGSWDHPGADRFTVEMFGNGTLWEAFDVTTTSFSREFAQTMADGPVHFLVQAWND